MNKQAQYSEGNLRSPIQFDDQINSAASQGLQSQPLMDGRQRNKSRAAKSPGRTTDRPNSNKPKRSKSNRNMRNGALNKQGGLPQNSFFNLFSKTVEETNGSFENDYLNSSNGMIDQEHGMLRSNRKSPTAQLVLSKKVDDLQKTPSAGMQEVQTNFLYPEGDNTLDKNLNATGDKQIQLQISGKRQVPRAKHNKDRANIKVPKGAKLSDYGSSVPTISPVGNKNVEIAIELPSSVPQAYKGGEDVKAGNNLDSRFFVNMLSMKRRPKTPRSQKTDGRIDLRNVNNNSKHKPQQQSALGRLFNVFSGKKQSFSTNDSSSENGGSQMGESRAEAYRLNKRNKMNDGAVAEPVSEPAQQLMAVARETARGQRGILNKKKYRVKGNPGKARGNADVEDEFDPLQWLNKDDIRDDMSNLSDDLASNGSMSHVSRGDTAIDMSHYGNTLGPLPIHRISKNFINTAEIGLPIVNYEESENGPPPPRFSNVNDMDFIVPPPSPDEDPDENELNAEALVENVLGFAGPGEKGDWHSNLANVESPAEDLGVIGNSFLGFFSMLGPGGKMTVSMKPSLQYYSEAFGVDKDDFPNVKPYLDNQGIKKNVSRDSGRGLDTILFSDQRNNSLYQLPIAHEAKNDKVRESLVEVMIDDADDRALNQHVLNIDLDGFNANAIPAVINMKDNDEETELQVSSAKTERLGEQARRQREFNRSKLFLDKVAKTKSTADIKNRYNLHNSVLLGSGSFGEVVKCRDEEADRTVALKMCKMDKEENIIDLGKEINLLRKVKECPYVIRFFECFQSGSDRRRKIYMSMELCEAGDLSNMMEIVSSGFTEPEILPIIASTLLALEFLHSKKIIHRDIKCANLMIGRSGLSKVGDFGVSRLVRSTMPKAMTLVGSPYWMAPETLSRGNKYNMKCDMWSLGITIVELFQINPPFFELDMEDVIMKIIDPHYSDKFSIPQEVRCTMTMKLFVDNLTSFKADSRPNASECIREVTSTFHALAECIDNLEKLIEMKYFDTFSPNSQDAIGFGQPGEETVVTQMARSTVGPLQDAITSRWARIESTRKEIQKRRAEIKAKKEEKRRRARKQHQAEADLDE